MPGRALLAAGLALTLLCCAQLVFQPALASAEVAEGASSAEGGSALHEHAGASWPAPQQRSLLQTPSPAPAAPPAPDTGNPSLMPLSGREIGMFLVAAVVLFIAAGAGVGGGPVLVPNYLLLGQLTNVAAVALSNVTILAGSVVNTAFNLFKRHPFRARALIDYDMILLMQPPTSLGERRRRRRHPPPPRGSLHRRQHPSGTLSARGTWCCLLALGRRGGGCQAPAAGAQPEAAALARPSQRRLPHGVPAGAVAGSYINKLMPPWISHALLALMLMLLSWRMTERAQQVGGPGWPGWAGRLAGGCALPGSSSSRRGMAHGGDA
jgi:hypothetical protein